MINPKEDEILVCGGFPSFASKDVGKAALSAPDRRKKWRGREKVRQRDESGPKYRDQAQDQQPMPVKPMHRGIISEVAEMVK